MPIPTYTQTKQKMEVYNWIREQRSAGTSETDIINFLVKQYGLRIETAARWTLEAQEKLA